MFGNKKLMGKLISSFVVIAVAVGILVGYRMFVNRNVQEGEKEITVEVKIDDEVNSITFNTDEEFLGQALDEENLIQTKDSTYGRYVVGVNGKLASNSDESWFTIILKKLGLKKDETMVDEDNFEWWYIEVNGEAATDGIDDIAIKDGDTIKFELKVGY